MNLREQNKRIGAIKRGFGAARKNVQEVAIGIVEHATGEGNGDVSNAAKLVRALPKQTRSQLVAYLAAYSPIYVRMGETAKDDKCGLRKRESDKYVPYNLDGMRANNWWDHEKPRVEAELVGLTGFREQVQKAIKRFENMLKDDKFVAGDADAIRADLAALHAAVQANGARQATPAMQAERDEFPPQEMRQVA